jgi:hypothetical protein
VVVLLVFLWIIVRAEYSEIGGTKVGAFHRRLLLQLRSCLVWNRGGTRDRGGGFAVRVR